MTALNPHGSSLNHHILSVLVQNRPGVLARVASLFARRGYNIFSLAVAPAEEDGMSRITIVVDVESSPLEQIVKQLFKLIDVVKISELDPRRCVERELLLATVRAPARSTASPPGTTGSPAVTACDRAVSLSPTACSDSTDGPTKTIPAASQASASVGFSDRKP